MGYIRTIYQPNGQAGEYSEWAANPYMGCGHKCAYCYVPRIPGQPDRKTFDAGAILKPGFLSSLHRDASRMAQSRGGDVSHMQVMISFTSDPYHPGDTTPTRKCWEILQNYGFSICALTKGGTRALRDIELFRPKHDAFASTLTALDDTLTPQGDNFAATWERDAAAPGDRIKALEAFAKRGVFTWVSLEPTIDVEASLAIVDRTHEFVDLYKVGRVNYINITRTTDWRTYTLRMIEKLQQLKKLHYIKKDLQSYLPKGYPNVLRLAQHH